MDESWQPPLLKAIRAQLAKTKWAGDFETGKPHLAILIEPYFSRVLDGTKTIESRFFRRKWIPFGMVKRGDTLIIKRSCGPIGGLCKIAEVHEFDLTQTPLDAIRHCFGPAMGVSDESFWKYQRQAQFVSLFRLEKLIPLPPLYCGKSDRRAWVVMEPQIDTDIHQARELVRYQFTVSLNPSSKPTRGR